MAINARETADKAATLVQLLRFVPLLSVPQLDTTTDLTPILAAAQKASIWIPVTAYLKGQIVGPVTRDGFWYICDTAGTSTATEPTWALTTNDGDNLIWKRYGPEKASLFDLRQAIHDAWTRKAALATVYYSEGGKQLEQVYEHCEKQAAKFAPISMF